MIESFAHKEARRLAQKLLAEAGENEPQITADLQKIASEISAEIIGLENRLKLQESLTQKIIDMANLRSQSFEDAAETINDSLRYTFIFAVKNYAESFHKTIELLWETGFYVPEKRIWNAWKNVGGTFDKGYRGINITVISSQKQNFEIQFHTDESYKLKSKIHDLYKESRQKQTSTQRRKEIKRIAIAEARKIKIPDGVK